MLGFTPSQVAEFSLPQFVIYSRYANEQKAFELNLKSVNEYLETIFGVDKKTEETKTESKGRPTVSECKDHIGERINNIDNIAKARDALKARTGRTEFDFSEIMKEILSTRENGSPNYKVEG